MNSHSQACDAHGPAMDSTPSNGHSLADDLFHRMIARIRSGEWSPGTALPGQRKLVEEFGVSGVPLREALSMLKSWGVLEIHQGRRTVVRRLDTDVLQTLLPLAFSFDDQESFHQICELRLALEPKSASLAAKHMMPDELAVLSDLIAKMRDTYEEGGQEFFDCDLAFHQRIADATGNPLFALLLKAIAGIVIHAQLLGCGHSKKRREMAVWSHELILDAIANRDSRRAFVEMEAHLHYTINHDPARQQAPASAEDDVNGTSQNVKTSMQT